MDAKLTLCFNESVIRKAKDYAAANNISLSRLTEYLLNKAVTSDYRSLEDLPISEWVSQVAEGDAEYHTKRTRKSAKKSFYDSHK